MKKITKKITTEEFKGGELIKRTIEETTEEINDGTKFFPVVEKKEKPLPWTNPWCTTTNTDNVALLKSYK